MIDGIDVQLIRTFLMMTREEFAERIGCSPQLVYAAESGRRGISPSLRRSLRRVVNGEEFRGMEKHGFILKTSYGDIFGNNHTMQITDLSTVDGLIEGGGVSETWETPAAITLGKLHIESYTRQVNHIVALLDQWTAADRVRKDDLGVMELMDDFTLAQITEFIAAAQEANANNVLAALLDYKNAHFADFDPMAEFTLEW